MPMYDYRCKNCGKKFEELVQSSSIPDSDIVCPNCNKKKSERLLSAPMVSTGKSSGHSGAVSTHSCGSSGFS